jgi:hypothetical protein
MQPRTDDRSLGDLFGDLTRDVGTLVRQEVQLATKELSEKVSDAGKDIGLLVGGGAVLYAGLLVLLGGITILLANVVPLWASAFIVAVVTMIVGYVLVQKGRDALKNLDLKPRKTMQTISEIKEDIT